MLNTVIVIDDGAHRFSADCNSNRSFCVVDLLSEMYCCTFCTGIIMAPPFAFTDGCRNGTQPTFMLIALSCDWLACDCNVWLLFVVGGRPLAAWWWRVVAGVCCVCCIGWWDCWCWATNDPTFVKACWPMFMWFGVGLMNVRNDNGVNIAAAAGWWCYSTKSEEKTRNGKEIFFNKKTMENGKNSAQEFSIFQQNARRDGQILLSQRTYL